MFQVVDTPTWRSMIHAMALVNDVFDEPHRDAIHMQGLQTKMIVVK